MESRINNEANINLDTAVAIPRDGMTYGSATGVDVAPRPIATASVGSWHQLSFVYGEYVKGLFFVLASLVFILAVPVVVFKPARALGMIYQVTKRLLDIMGALVGLVLTIPLWIVLPILIKLGSKGPVFYTQLRVGQNRRRTDRRYHQRTDSGERRRRDRRREDYQGQTFSVIKFRTMVHDAEKKCGPVWATQNDPRVTRLGRFMRITRLDEIPQFLNVLLGDMSLVGPRPERPAFVEDLSTKIDNYNRRLDVKPGLTGLAQIESGYDSSLASVVRKVSYDLEYIDNQSLWLDIKILLRTIGVVITGKGAC